MYSLPSLTPQDSHTLWYTSSQVTGSINPPLLDGSIDHPASTTTPPTHRRHNHAHHRSPLARLRLDEEYMARRKANVQNYGNSWIKPPGISKSLSQMREEKREMEEHQEAMRREALAQELAEAEAEGLEDMLREEGIGGEGEGEGEAGGRDLDDDVPEADATGLGDEDDDEDDDDERNGEGEVPPGVLASRMPEDVYREALVRGEDARGTLFGDEVGSALDEEDREGMLQEEDLVHETHMQEDLDMDEGVNLDDDIPEADEGGYEHTDTEAELSSSEEESVDGGLFTRHQPASSMVRSDGTQNSMDIGSLRSHGSSQIGSSPGPRPDFRGRRSGH